MAWLTENWFWILTFIAFVAMHLFGHGGHGGHGGGEPRTGADASQADKAPSSNVNNKAGGHQH